MAGTTTVLQFNPNQTNQETDTTYLEDSNRSGGFGTDAIWPSPLANKTLNQLSNYLYALFTAFAQKGFTTNDDNVPLLISICSNFLTTADILPAIVSVAYSPTPSFNAATSNGFQMPLMGNVTSSTISGVTPGQLLAFYFVQDSVGGRTVSYPASFVGAIQPDTTANAVSLQMFRADLSGVPRAVTPLVSNNGVFFATPVTVPALLTATSFTLSGGAAIGTHLIGNGSSFLARKLASSSNLAGSSRFLATTYTNTSAAEMFVTATAYITGSYGQGFGIAGIVNGVKKFTNGVHNDQGECSVIISVPQGATYSVAINNGNVSNPQTPTLDSWIEDTYV